MLLRLTKKEEIEAINNEIQIAQREGNLEKAAELKYSKLPAIKKQLEEESKGFKFCCNRYGCCDKYGQEKVEE